MKRPRTIHIGVALAVAVLSASLGLRAKRRVTGSVTVSVYDDGQPLADRWVVFHGPDGAVVATLKSGTDGKATSEVPAGGMVTVAYGTSIRQLVTVGDVQPGDVIEIGEHDNDEKDPGDTAGVAKIVLPGASPEAARYSVNVGVGVVDPGSPTAPVRVPILRRFVGDDGTFTVLALGEDAAGRSVAFSLARANLADAEIRLPTWRTDFRTSAIALERAPFGLRVRKGELAIFAKEQRFDHVATGGATLDFAVPRALEGAASYRIELRYDGSPDAAVIVRRSSAMAVQSRIDLSEQLLPRVSEASVASSGDGSRPLVRWKVEGDPAKADAAVVQLSWPKTKEHVWTILRAPSRDPHALVPALPAVLAGWQPDGRALTAAVALVESTEFAGYADIRRSGIHHFGETPAEDGAMRISTTGDIDF